MIWGQNLKFAPCLFMVTVDQEVSESVVRGSPKPFTKISNWASSGGWRHLSCLSGKLALGSKPPPVTRIARTGLGTRLGLLAFFHHRTKKLSGYNTNSNGPGMEQVVQTHRTSCRSGFERLSERVSVFYAYSVSSSPLFYLFTSATVRIAVHTTPKCDTKPIRYVTLFTKIQDHADQKIRIIRIFR